MDEHVESSGMSRRDLLKRSAVVGGLVWVAPTLLASPANASLVTCPADQRYAIKHNAPNHGCETPGTNPSTGNCAASGGFTAFRSGCCLEAANLVTFTESADGTTHTYVLAVGVGIAQAFGKCGNTCFSHAYPQNSSSVVRVLYDTPGPGQTTVIVSCASLSHSELVVCMSGTNIPSCP